MPPDETEDVEVENVADQDPKTQYIVLGLIKEPDAAAGEQGTDHKGE